MKVTICVVLLSACASVSPVKTSRIVSAAPIDPGAALESAIQTVQGRFRVIGIDLDRRVFATVPERIDDTGASVSYVVEVGEPSAACGHRGRRGRGGCQGRMNLRVTPVAFVGSETLPPDRVPLQARETARDLVDAIHLGEQQQHVVH